jgi:hypothetical protein
MAFWTECACPRPFRRTQFALATGWCDDTNPCILCGAPIHWYGEWRPPKQNANAGARRYEVLSVIRVNEEDSPSGCSRWDDDGYFPVLMVCQNRDNLDDYILWPRYWLAPDEGRKTRQYGQEAPQLRIEEWEYLLRKAREFLQRRSERPDGNSPSARASTQLSGDQIDPKLTGKKPE